MFTQDAQRRMTFVSHDFAGVSSKEMIGLREEEILPPETSAIVIAEKKHVLASGEVRSQTFRCGTKRAGQRWYKLRDRALREDDRIVGVIGCAVDVTGEKRSERRLRSLTEELDSTVQRFQNRVARSRYHRVRADRDRRFTWLSADVRGVPAQEFIGRSEDEMLPADLDLADARVQAGGARHGRAAEWRIPACDLPRASAGTTSTSKPSAKTRAGAVVGLLGAAVDITELASGGP